MKNECGHSIILKENKCIQLKLNKIKSNKLGLEYPCLQMRACNQLLNLITISIVLFVIVYTRLHVLLYIAL